MILLPPNKYKSLRQLVVARSTLPIVEGFDYSCSEAMGGNTIPLSLTMDAKIGQRHAGGIGNKHQGYHKRTRPGGQHVSR